jgi:hypothetical protein
LTASAAIWCSLLGSAASAGGVWTDTHNGPAVEETVKVLIAFDGSEEALVEEVLVQPRAQRFAWIRMFPSRPEIRSADINTFRTLEADSALRAPFRDGVLDSVFGPSLLSILTHLGRGPTLPPPLEEAGPRHIAIADRGIELFTGPTWSSTITKRRFFPRDFEAWLQRFDLVPSERERFEVLKAFDAGWSVAALMIDNSAKLERLVVGPTLYRFKTTRALHPGEFVTTVPRDAVSYFLVADKALAPTQTLWSPDERPWDREAPRPENRFLYSYNHQMDPRLALDVDEVLGSGWSGATHLVRGTYKRTAVLGRDVSFDPAELTPLPLPSGRGSPIDIILCMILGITPLLYTPESWILFMLGLRSRDKRRNAPDVISPASLMWPLYALVVAIYWVVHLESSGRMAALIPLFVGIFQLASPPPERERRPIRIDFARRKKGKKKPDEAKPSKPPEAAGSG